MTTVLQIVALTVVMLLGVAVVATKDPTRQAVVNGGFGLSLVLLFVVLQAPDVAISEIVVGTIAAPLLLLATIHQTKGNNK